jgi:phosphopentomutase
MMRFNRVCLLVLDACGVGELPDAEAYGDAGSNTLGHCAEAVGGLKMPTMGRMGLGNIIPIRGIPETSSPKAYMPNWPSNRPEKIPLLDIGSLPTYQSQAFPLYPNGFRKRLSMNSFVNRSGR